MNFGDSRKSKPERGVRPARQKRSLATREALIDAGVRLMRRRPLSEITIVEIAAEAGTSVGAFYSRFTDKEGYFDALQSRELERAIAKFAERVAGEGPVSLDARVDVVVRATVEIFRDLEGIIYTSIKRETAEPGAWTPLYETGARNGDRMVAYLVPVLQRADREFRVRVMIQVLYGTLVNAVLHSPPPLDLHDDRMIEELTTVALSYLQAPAPGPGGAVLRPE